MRQFDLPSELEAQIESLRGDTPFQTWVALAIQEKVFWGTRFSVAGNLVGAPDEAWMAMVELDTGQETVLLWRVSNMMAGVSMMPVIVFHEEDMQTWEDQMALEINLMDGPPIMWRHFEGGDFVSWLRAPEPEHDR